MRLLIFVGFLATIVGVHATVAAATFELAPQVTKEINVNIGSDPTWLPRPEQQSLALETVELYLETIDGARYAEAYAMHDPVFQAYQTLDLFIELEERVRTVAGPTELWRVLKVTWSKDPEYAPGPGIYAAIDLTALFEKADRYCGYIILYQETETSDFRVMRREFSILDNASASSIEAEQSKAHVEELWAEMSQYCPNYVPITEIQ